MTNKQKEYIEFIYDRTGIKFTGNPNSVKDISDYINKYKNNPRNFEDLIWATAHGY